MADLSAADLYQRLTGSAPPRILDVRNAEEFARWWMEGLSMDVMGIAREELIDGVEVGGVATLLGDAARSRVALFV